MAQDLIMPRWAVVGAEVAQIHMNSGAGLGSGPSEGRKGKITRVLKTQVEVEFPYFRQEDPKATVLVKFKLKRGYTPYGKDNVRVDTLTESERKYGNDILWPVNGKQVASLRVRKDILQNSHKMQGVAMAFAKKSSYHLGPADVSALLEELTQLSKDRMVLEERILEIDEMPQDR